MTDADRPVLTEIEITPEMIEAGEEALTSRLGGAVGVVVDYSSLALSVWRAMAAQAD